MKSSKILEGINRHFRYAVSETERNIEVIHRGYDYKGENNTLIHHYTSLDGLMGILGSKTMRATSVEYMNDTTEVVYGIIMAREVVKDVLECHASPTTDEFIVVNAFVKTVQSHIEEFLDTPEARRNGSGYYAVCFCEEHDQLSQWRAYGGRAGFSLDFNAEEFVNSVSIPTNNQGQGGDEDLQEPTETLDEDLSERNDRLYLKKVIYKKDDQRDLMKRLLEACIECFDRFVHSPEGLGQFHHVLDRDKETIPKYISKMADYTMKKLLRCASILKHPRFSEENEQRLVYRRNSDATFSGLRFRKSPRGRYIIPYTEITVDLSKCLRSITCGPSLPLLSSSSVYTFLAAKGLGGIEVNVAEVPLRL